MNFKSLGIFCLIILFVACTGKSSNGNQSARNPKNIPAYTTVHTGWSVKEDPYEAVKEATDGALKNGKTRPEYVIIYANSGSNLEEIIKAARNILGSEVKIYGGTSDSRAVMSDKGYVKITNTTYDHSLLEGKRGIVLMTISSSEITFGVGAVSYSEYSSPEEAGKSAMRLAMKDAALEDPLKKPAAVLVTMTIGTEEETLKGIESVVGTDTIILGGTTGGPEHAVFGKDGIYPQGISITALYTDLEIGWAFEAGFVISDNYSGIVTATRGQAILEIDNKPALDVYNAWLGGKINELSTSSNDSGEVRDLLTLHPIYRKYTSSENKEFCLFSHPWPREEFAGDKAVMTSTKIMEGERIYLSHGTWDTLVNRIARLPQTAQNVSQLSDSFEPVLSFGIICAGVLGVIPENERGEMPILINNQNNNTPFIVNFSWGETGFFPGIGTRHGNLSTSFLTIGRTGKR